MPLQRPNRFPALAEGGIGQGQRLGESGHLTATSPALLRGWCAPAKSRGCAAARRPATGRSRESREPSMSAVCQAPAASASWPAAAKHAARYVRIGVLSASSSHRALEARARLFRSRPLTAPRCPDRTWSAPLDATRSRNGRSVSGRSASSRDERAREELVCHRQEHVGRRDRREAEAPCRCHEHGWRGHFEASRQRLDRRVGGRRRHDRPQHVACPAEAAGSGSTSLKMARVPLTLTAATSRSTSAADEALAATSNRAVNASRPDAVGLDISVHAAERHQVADGRPQQIARIDRPSDHQVAQPESPRPRSPRHGIACSMVPTRSPSATASLKM